VKGTRIVVTRIVSLVIAAGLLAGMAFGVLATAQSPRPDNQRHLLLVPSNAEGTAALARTDARVLARYESFSVVEAQGGDDQRLRSAGAERRDDMRTVETAAGAIDPTQDRSSLAAKEGPDREETLALVQFVGPPKEAWLERLRETGARIVTYQADNAYVVHASGAAVDRVAALQGGHPAVRAVSVLTAADKLEERSSGSGVFAVTTVTGAPGEEARDGAAALAGPATAAPVRVGALRTEYRELSSAEVTELARDPGVVAVEAYAEPGLFDERAAQIVAGRLISPAFTQPLASEYVPWLVNPQRIPTNSNFEFAIDVTDTGFDNGTNAGHGDFRVLGAGASRVAYLHNYTADSNARDCRGHGTNVASIAVGYNDQSNQPAEADGVFNHGMGVAPFALVGASKLFDCTGDAVDDWNPIEPTAAAYAGLARISNNSWGSGNDITEWGSYAPISAVYDALVRDAHPAPGHQPMVEVFAAGNHGDDAGGEFREGYGTISMEGSAKNVITVGAAESSRPNVQDLCATPQTSADSARDIVNFSSRGPTDDGRLKPDLVAPGTHVTGAEPDFPGYNGLGTCGPFPTDYSSVSAQYSIASGTSQAAPGVSGAAALVRRWYKHANGADPSPALTKALLVNTATDLAGGDNGKGDAIGPGPNTDQGWGRVNVGNVFDSTARVFRDQLPADVLSGSGENRLQAYAVQNSGAPVKLTLAWTDAPGSTVGSAIVNDLDLVVEAGGRTYKGNVFANGESRTGGSADPRNNVESVYLPQGTSGRFAVKVVGTNIPGDGIPGNPDPTDQDFALVVSNATEQTSPVLVHEHTTIDDSPAAGGDGDGALEEGESFELGERLRNAGNAGATGVSGTLSGISGVTVNPGQDDSTWPNIAAGASQPSDAGFEGQVTAACGEDIKASLAVSTAQWPTEQQTVPLTLPTGTEGAPVSASRTHPGAGLVIPDDDAGGVASTINVGTTGPIRDVDVRVTELDHEWVGDLRMDLTAPDGTTVRLVEHPGGPDNSGKGFGFIDTWFDDEAPTAISIGAPYTGRFRPQNDQLSRFDGRQQPHSNWTLRVRDLFQGDEGTLDEWRIDITPAVCSLDATTPDTTINSGPGEGATVSATSPEFTFSSDVGGATFECQLDGGAFGPCGSPTTYTGLSSGTHTFRVRAKAGLKVDPTPATRTWNIDTIPPDTNITFGPSGRVGATSASFQFVSPDSPSATFECSLDDHDVPGTPDFASCAEPHAYTGLDEGRYTFRVQAWDGAGNVDPTPATRTWDVDLTGPSPSITSPGELQTTTDITPTISGTASTAANDSDIVAVKVYAGPSAGGTPVRTMSTTRGAGGTWSVNVLPPLFVGQFTVQAEQADDTVPPNVGKSDEVTFNIGPDFVPPETTIVSGPAGAVASGDAVFTFGSSEPGSDFSCSLNGAGSVPCSSSYSVSGLGDGNHTLSVTAIDPAGNPDPSPASRSWTVDVTAPAPTVTAPADGQRVLDTTPTLRGTAGISAGDAGIVTVKLWSGTLAGGMPAQMIVVPRDSASGTWSAEPAELARGNWTVQVEQGDAVGHVGSSAPSVFTVASPDLPPPAAPSFMLAPAEERIAEALAGRLTAVSGCATACRIDARLTASSRAARSLGLGPKSTVLGKGSKRLSGTGTATAAVRLNKRAKAALRRRDTANLSLRVKLTEGGKTLALSRTVSLRRSAGLRRIASRGLRLWAVCSAQCPLSGKLTLSAKEARRIGLKPRGSKRMQVAAGKATGEAGKPARLTLKVRRGAKKAMGRARRLRALLETVAGTAPNPRRTVSRALTLRR
jgi:subtilisin-like proprotein convertase family protein